MKNIKRRMCILLTACIMFLSIATFVSNGADGTMSVEVSKTDVNVGDSFTVTVKYSGSTVVAYAAWNLTYDISLVSCGGYEGSIPGRFDPDQIRRIPYL